MTRREILVFAIAILVLPLGLSAQEYQPDFTQRYVWLPVKSADALPAQLKAAAAAAGYRLVAAPYGEAKRLNLIMEKVATPPDLYEYEVFDPCRDTMTGKEVARRDEAYGHGFRVLGWALIGCRDIGFDYEGTLMGVGAIQIMEKRPGQPRSQTEYQVLQTSRTSTLEKEINQAGAEGYRPIGLFIVLSDYYALLERTVGESRQTTEQAADLGSSPRFKLLVSMRLATVEKELRQAAASGYRALMTAAKESPALLTTGQMVLILLEKTETSGYDYVVVGSKDPSDLRQKLQQAAAKGFQLMPQTLVRRIGLTAMLTLLMEKRPGAPCCYDYEVVSVSAKDPAGVQKEITLAVEKGLRPLGLWWKLGREDIVILEKVPPQATTGQ